VQGSSCSGTVIPPSHLHLSPYGYALPPYGPPFGALPPPSLRFPPHPASLADPQGYSSLPGQRGSFDSLEGGSGRGDEEKGSSAGAQKRKFDDSAPGDEVDELESDAGSQYATVAGWGAQVQASLSGGGSQAGEQEEEEEEQPKAKKPIATKGVHVVNPYNIPTVSPLSS
jgi:hypothetical protein